MKLSDHVMDFLAGLGVRHVFFVPGGGAMHLNDSLGRHPDLVPVCCLHEQAAVIAAEYHARVTGRLGVALVTCGPGGTNAVTGVASAWADSVPLLVISGQVKRGDMLEDDPDWSLRQRGVQEMPIVDVVKSITKYAKTVKRSEQIDFWLTRATQEATTDRPGPTWLDIPLDVQAFQAEGFGKAKVVPGTEEEEQRQECIRSAEQVLTLLQESSRPILLLGNGVRCSGAIEECRQLVDRLGVPVLTTWPAMDLLPDDHPLLIGRPGSLAPRGANWCLQRCDLLLSIGVRFDPVLTAYAPEKVAEHAKRIVVDVDPAELAKPDRVVKVGLPNSRWADVPILADAGAFMREMLRQTEGYDADYCDAPSWSKKGQWRHQCRQWREDHPVVLPEHRQPDARVSSYHFAEVLSEELAEGDVVVVGSSGSAIELFLLAFKAKAGQRVLCSTGLGAMGFGIPGAIGAALASGKRVVCVDGDGGFQLNVQELATVRRLGLPIKFFVLNNGGFASIRASQRRWFGRTVGADEASGLWLPEIKEVAEAYGVDWFEILSQGNLRQRIQWSLSGDQPCVIDVWSEPDEVRQPCVTVTQHPDGTMSSGSLEAMWPPLEE